METTGTALTLTDAVLPVVVLELHPVELRIEVIVSAVAPVLFSDVPGIENVPVLLAMVIEAVSPVAVFGDPRLYVTV